MDDLVSFDPWRTCWVQAKGLWCREAWICWPQNAEVHSTYAAVQIRRFAIIENPVSVWLWLNVGSVRCSVFYGTFLKFSILEAMDTCWCCFARKSRFTKATAL